MSVKCRLPIWRDCLVYQIVHVYKTIWFGSEFEHSGPISHFHVDPIMEKTYQSSDEYCPKTIPYCMCISCLWDCGNVVFVASEVLGYRCKFDCRKKQFSIKSTNFVPTCNLTSCLRVAFIYCLVQKNDLFKCGKLFDHVREFFSHKEQIINSMSVRLHILLLGALKYAHFYH